MLNTQMCDRCWELDRRIQADTALARRILDDTVDPRGCFESFRDMEAASEGEGDMLAGMHNLIDVDELFETGSYTVETFSKKFEVTLNIKEIKS